MRSNVPRSPLHCKKSPAAQIGAEYAQLRQFRAKVLATLKKINWCPQR
jgi:hypothetical protein